MKNSTDQIKIGTVELIYFLIGVLVLLVLATIIGKGQSGTQQRKAIVAHKQIQQPLYAEYRGVRLGMTAVEVRAKLGEPALKSDEQDFYVLSRQRNNADCLRFSTKGRYHFHGLQRRRGRA